MLRTGMVGTEYASRPSTNSRPWIFTGRNIPGYAQLARTGSISGPESKTTPSPVTKAVAGDRPLGKVLETHQPSEFFHLFCTDTAAVGRSQQCAYAGSSNVADGDVFFFEDFQDADVSQSAGKTAAQRQADLRLVLLL